MTLLESDSLSQARRSDSNGRKADYTAKWRSGTLDRLLSLKVAVGGGASAALIMNSDWTACENDLGEQTVTVTKQISSAHSNDSCRKVE